VHTTITRTITGSNLFHIRLFFPARLSCFTAAETRAQAQDYRDYSPVPLGIQQKAFCGRVAVYVPGGFKFLDNAAAGSNNLAGRHG
jgi:hypothetical protein